MAVVLDLRDVYALFDDDPDTVVAPQFRDQLDDLNKGSTLNVGNMIVFRVNGRDSYSLASQLDNTPPPADTRVEPVYQYYEYKGQDFLVATGLCTGEGKLYQEVELPSRAYSDVEAEMANQLSILPNFQAWCRLIDVPDAKGELPRLVERKIVTEELGAIEWDPSNAGYIRKRSSGMALPKAEVERQRMERLRNPNKTQEKPVSSAQVIGDL